MPDRVFTQCFVVVGALIERDGKFLLVREGAEKGPDAGKYNKPGGWLEVGEHPLEAVVREVKEETGFDFTPTHLLGAYSWVREDLRQIKGSTPHGVHLTYVGHISETSDRVLADDVTSADWLSADQIEAMDATVLRDMNVKQMIQDYQSNRRFPLDLIHHSVTE